MLCLVVTNVLSCLSFLLGKNALLAHVIDYDGR